MPTYVRITYGASTLTRGGGLTTVMPYNITSDSPPQPWELRKNTCLRDIFNDYAYIYIYIYIYMFSSVFYFMDSPLILYAG